MDIENYDHYIIYEDSRIYSRKTKKFLKQIFNKTNGYVYVGLTKNSKTKQHLLHRLVALHYLPNPNNYSDVDHIDSDKTNNNLSNLRWCSRSQNNEFKKSKYYCNHSNGGFSIQIKRNGVKFTKYVKTEEQAQEIIKDYFDKIKNSVIS